MAWHWYYRPIKLIERDGEREMNAYTVTWWLTDGTQQSMQVAGEAQRDAIVANCEASGFQSTWF